MSSSASRPVFIWVAPGGLPPTDTADDDRVGAGARAGQRAVDPVIAGLLFEDAGKFGNGGRLALRCPPVRDLEIGGRRHRRHREGERDDARPQQFLLQTATYFSSLMRASSAQLVKHGRRPDGSTRTFHRGNGVHDARPLPATTPWPALFLFEPSSAARCDYNEPFLAEAHSRHGGCNRLHNSLVKGGGVNAVCAHWRWPGGKGRWRRGATADRRRSAMPGGR